MVAAFSATPERFERVYRASVDRSNPEGFTGQYAGKISQREAHDVLEGKLPDGTEFPVYPFDEFKRGVAGPADGATASSWISRWQGSSP